MSISQHKYIIHHFSKKIKYFHQIVDISRQIVGFSAIQRSKKFHVEILSIYYINEMSIKLQEPHFTCCAQISIDFFSGICYTFISRRNAVINQLKC